MAQTGVIIRRNASMMVPDDYLTLALEQNPTAWGCAIVSPEGLMTNSGAEPMDPEVLRDTLKDFDARNIYFYLCNSESAINMDDVSPHWLLEKDDNPLLIGFIEGSFPGFAKTDSSHPSEFHFLQDFLQPKINDLWELCDGDLVKLMTFIEKPGFKKDVMIHANPRGNVTLVGANGKALTFAQGDTWAEYKWGWVSQNYGYARAKEEPVKAEEPKRKSLFPNKSTVREAAPKASVPESKVGNAPKGGEAVMNFGVRKEAPKATDARKDRKLFYQRRIGYCPIGWEQHVAIDVWFDLKTNQTVFLNEIKKLGVEAVGVPKLNNPMRAESKDTEADNIGGGRETGPAVTTETLPIMPPKSREFAKDILRREDVKKMIAENGEALSDPSTVADQEAKFTDFSTQLGMKEGIRDFMRLDYAWHKKMAADPDLIANYAWNLRNMVISQWIKLGSKLTTEEVHVAAKEELAPAKKSLFPQKKQAVA